MEVKFFLFIVCIHCYVRLAGGSDGIIDYVAFGRCNTLPRAADIPATECA